MAYSINVPCEPLSGTTKKMEQNKVRMLRDASRVQAVWVPFKMEDFLKYLDRHDVPREWLSADILTASTPLMWPLFAPKGSVLPVYTGIAPTPNYCQVVWTRTPTQNGEYPEIQIGPNKFVSYYPLKTMGLLPSLHFRQQRVKMALKTQDELCLWYSALGLTLDQAYEFDHYKDRPFHVVWRKSAMDARVPCILLKITRPDRTLLPETRHLAIPFHDIEDMGALHYVLRSPASDAIPFHLPLPCPSHPLVDINELYEMQGRLIHRPRANVKSVDKARTYALAILNEDTAHGSATPAKTSSDTSVIPLKLKRLVSW